MIKQAKRASILPQFLLVAVACLLLNVSLVVAQQSEKQLRIVSRVVDGDTIVLENGEKVRLIGVDTPETHDPRKPVEYFGKEATDFTRSLVEGQRIFIETDPANSHLGHKDKYGRTLAYVWNQQGKFVNAEIVEQGYGHAMTQYPFKYLNEFRGLEQHARQQGAGLWMTNAEAPQISAYRKSNSTDRTAHTLSTPPFRAALHGRSESDALSSSLYVNDPVVGHTATGIPIYEGPRGGHYHVTSGGHKSYSTSGGSRSTGGGGRR
jgi:endonuclease YncB( thermonuclease family)